MFSLLMFFMLKILKVKNDNVISILAFIVVFIVDKGNSNQLYFWIVENATYFIPIVY